MTQWHGGKGSGSRPLSVTQDEYANRWDLIFGREDTGRDKAKIEEQEPVEDIEEEEEWEQLDLFEDTEHDCESEE